MGPRIGWLLAYCSGIPRFAILKVEQIRDDLTKESDPTRRAVFAGYLTNLL